MNPYFPINLQGKTALICGSTQGIGWATAEILASLGATCILMARNETALQEKLNLLPRPDLQTHHYLVADFSDPNQVQQAAMKIAHTLPVHILINNTGGPASGPASTAPTEAFEKAFQQHLVCNQHLVQALLPGMKAAGYGRIINIISVSVKIPIPNLGVSNTIRAAVAAWAKTLSLELASHGITVNNVLPGFTDTERLRSLMAANAERFGKSELAIQQEMLSSVPANRFGTASEVAAVAAFLASPAASYVNGTSIPVDGGRTPSI